jgi:predicted transcriptional regulator
MRALKNRTAQGMPSTMISPRQIRSARALLGMSQTALAQKSGLAEATVVNIETGRSDPRASTLRKIQAALEADGAIFLNDSGVKLRPGR